MAYQEEMVHAGLVMLIVVTGCRIGFDPVEEAETNAETDAETDAGVFAMPLGGCVAGSPCSVIADEGTLVNVVCTQGLDCSVECGLAAACVVDCNGASSCLVSCPAVGCSVSQCDATCAVGCGQASLPSRHGATATCP